jgi:hypothetical protein
MAKCFIAPADAGVIFDIKSAHGWWALKKCGGLLRVRIGDGCLVE